MAKKKKSKEIASKVSYWVEAFVVKLSLQNPDYGAKRLVRLLDNEGITVATSAVYTILKRNDLQNKSLRLAKLEEHRTAEMVPEPATITDPPADTTAPAPVPVATDESTPESPLSSAIKSPSKTRARRLWSLNPLNILLLGLVGYFWFSALGNLLEARREPNLPHDLAPVAVETAPQVTVRPLEDYSIIFERNLFGASTGQSSSPEKTVSLEDIPTAEKSLGLKLVGTVAGDDPATSFAIIDNKTTRKQELYHEGDKAGEVLIKKILRNNVVINAGRGDEILTLELEESSKGKTKEPRAPKQPKQKIISDRPPSSPYFTEVDRAELELSLSNVDQLRQQITITPYMKDGQSSGFKISKLSSESIFKKIGIRDGDVIRGVNNKAISSPDEITELITELRQGGEVTVKIRRARRTRYLHLKIE